jgi:plastocyanin
MDFSKLRRLPRFWYIIGASGVTLFIILFSFFLRYTAAPTTPDGNSAPNTDSTGSPTNETSLTGQSTSTVASDAKKTPSPTQSSPFFFNLPERGDQLIIKEPHQIQWNKSIGRSGYLTLNLASDNKPIGVITSHTDTAQTSYLWDGRYVSVGRYSPMRKEVASGSYRIAFISDGPASSFFSEPFELVYPEQITYTTHEISITDNSFSRATLTVKRGDTIIFINTDDYYHVLGSSHLGQSTLAPGERFSVNTALLSTVSHVDFYDPEYPGMKFGLTIRAP